MNRENIAALLDVVAWAEERLNLETVEIGKPAEADVELIAHLIGQNLCYKLSVDFNKISLSCSNADQTSEPRHIVNVEIKNLRVIATLIKKLEESGLRNVDQQPIE
jgi:hypothetical protein